jgi:two-component system, LytTR family, response regulator AlgR
VRVLIVDDEAPARDRLARLLEDDPQHSVVGEAGNGEQALEVAAETKPDVVLLDIRMPGISGIEVAHHLNSLAEPPAVIFTTAYDEYAIAAFDANAVGYVLKPVRQERLEKALRQAARISSSSIGQVAEKSGLQSTRNHICARVRERLILIEMNKVSRFHADQKYVRVHHDGGEHLIDESLKALEREFRDMFVRIHRSALVSIAHIDAIRKTSDGQMIVVMRGAPEDEDSLIISRRHLADVKRRLKGV